MGQREEDRALCRDSAGVHDIHAEVQPHKEPVDWPEEHGEPSGDVGQLRDGLVAVLRGAVQGQHLAVNGVCGHVSTSQAGWVTA